MWQVNQLGYADRTEGGSFKGIVTTGHAEALAVLQRMEGVILRYCNFGKRLMPRLGGCPDPNAEPCVGRYLLFGDVGPDSALIGDAPFAGAPDHDALARLVSTTARVRGAIRGRRPASEWTAG